MECHVAAAPNLIEGGGVVPFELARPRAGIGFPEFDWTPERYARFWQERADAKADPDRRTGTLVYRRVAGRLECVGVHFGDTGTEELPDAPQGPLKAALLHGLPWAGIMAEGAAVVADMARELRRINTAPGVPPWSSEAELAQSRAEGPNRVDRWLASTTPEVGGGRHDSLFWEAVAQIYCEAWDEHLNPNPVKVVASRMAARLGRPVPDSTAKRWVREARRLRYLPPAPGARRAGYERDRA
jgi:hypothetical protein